MVISNSAPTFAYQNDQRNKIYTLVDFEDKTPTYMPATHAISKSERNFQTRNPKELGKIFYLPRFGVFDWITSNIQILLKNHLYKEVMTIHSSELQPNESDKKINGILLRSFGLRNSLSEDVYLPKRPRER